jgi:hypothetical protein
MPSFSTYASKPNGSNQGGQSQIKNVAQTTGGPVFF